MSEMAKKWGVPKTLVRRYCQQARTKNLVQEHGAGLIPDTADKPQAQNITVYEDASPLVKKIKYQSSKNKHF